MEFGESAQDRADRIDVRARREIPSGEEWFAGAGDQRHDAGVAGRIRDGRRLLDGEGEGFGRPRHDILSTAFGRAEYLEPPQRQIGSASWRERVCPYVLISGVAV